MKDRLWSKLLMLQKVVFIFTYLLFIGNISASVSCSNTENDLQYISVSSCEQAKSDSPLSAVKVELTWCCYTKLAHLHKYVAEANLQTWKMLTGSSLMIGSLVAPITSSSASVWNTPPRTRKEGENTNVLHVLYSCNHCESLNKETPCVAFPVFSDLRCSLPGCLL